MKKNTSIKILISALMILASMGVCAAKTSETLPNLSKVLEQKILRLQQEHAAKSAAQLKTVKALWNVYNTKTVSRRKVTVTFPWGKPTVVETACSAIEKDGALYVAQSCYEPASQAHQYRQWIGTKLVQGNSEYELARPTAQESGFVVFELPTLPSEVQSKFDCRA